MFEYKAGFKWWRGNAWSSPRREKKKKARKEGRHIHIPGGAERRERNEKKKKLIIRIK